MNKLLLTPFHLPNMIVYTCVLACSLSAAQINEINNSDRKLSLPPQESNQTLEEVCLEDQLDKLLKPPLDDKTKKELFEAVKGDNVKKVEELLKNYKDVVSARGGYGVTAFHCAALNGNVRMAKLLKKNGADVKTTNSRKDNALHLACYFSKNPAMIIWLLEECNLCLEAKGYCKNTPLLCAVLKNSLKILKLLIEVKANVNIQDEKGYTAMHIAAKGNHVDVAKLLIEAKANVNIQDEEGYTALHIAAKGNHVDVAKLLIKAKANEYTRTSWFFGSTPLDVAKEYKNQEMIDYLESQIRSKAERYGGDYWYSWF